MEKYKKETIDAYNKNAKIFSHKFKNLTDLKRRYEFHKFMDLLQGKDILDLGCGSGDHSEYFAKNGLNVTCIDLSKEMIKLCKEKKLNALIMDIESLKFNPESFDGIWAVTSLLHIPKAKIPLVINNLHRILKNEGILYVCVKEGEGEGLIKSEEYDSQRFFSFWKKEELLNMFNKKFSLIKFEEAKLGHTNFLQFFFKKSGYLRNKNR